MSKFSKFINSCVSSVLLTLNSKWYWQIEKQLFISIEFFTFFLQCWSQFTPNAINYNYNRLHIYTYKITVKSLLINHRMKSFNFNLRSCIALARSQISFSFSWNFKFSSFICSVILVWECKSHCCLFCLWLLDIWQIFLYFQENIELELTAQQNSHNSTKEHWERSHETIKFTVFYFFQQFYSLVMLHCISIYTLNNFNNCIHDKFHGVCFRKLSTNILRCIIQWNKDLKETSFPF